MGRQLSSNRLLHRTVSLYSELWESCLLKKMSLPVLIIHVCLVESALHRLLQTYIEATFKFHTGGGWGGGGGNRKEKNQ